MVIRRECYRCDSLSGPDPGGTLAIDLNFLVVVRARRFAVSTVADYACLPTSVCVIVAKSAKFRVQTAARINERISTILEGVVVLVAVEAKPPVFRRVSARVEGERRPLQRGGSSVSNEALTAKTSAQ